jgi:hypothetical protein
MPIGDFPWDTEFFDDALGDREPTDVMAGDTLSWTRSSSTYSGADGWTLTYVLNSSTQRYVVAPDDVVASGDLYTITIPSAETTGWKPGNYQWIAVAQLAASGETPAQRVTLALGRVVVAFDLLDATSPQDTRSKAEIALCNIEDMIAGRGSDGVQEYTINGRMLRRYSLTELMSLRSLYTSIVRQERADRGEVLPSRTVSVHFCG